MFFNDETIKVPEDTNLDIITDHAGIGIGLVTALRSTPFRLVFGEVPIPNELFPKSYPYGRLVEEVFKQQQNHGDDDDDDGDTTALLSEQDTKQLQEAVRYVADVAAQHFTYTRTYQSYIPSNCKSCVLLPMIPSLHYLSNLQDAKYNILDPALMDPHSKRLKLLLLLSRTWLTGIF